MAQKTKQWGAIIIMIALFAMIAFVTNLCTPMATIIKNQGPISNVLAQIGNYGNFIAYLVMGIPAGMLISKYGYKKTALIGLVVGSVGILIQWISGLMDVRWPAARPCRRAARRPPRRNRPRRERRAEPGFRCRSG